MSAAQVRSSIRLLDARELLMLIVLNKPGRLGNRLRVGAMFMAFSLGHDVPVVNLAFDEYAQYFTGPCRDLFCSIPPRSSFFASSTPVRHSLYKVGSKVPGLLCRMDRRWRVAPVIRLGWHEVCDLGATAFVDFVRSRRIILVQGWHFVDELSLLTYGPHIARISHRAIPTSPGRSASSRTLARMPTA